MGFPSQWKYGLGERMLLVTGWVEAEMLLRQCMGRDLQQRINPAQNVSRW